MLSFISCLRNNSIVSGDLEINVNENMQVLLNSKFAESPLFNGYSETGKISVVGKNLTFKLTNMDRLKVRDSFGTGVEYIFKGETPDGFFKREMHISVYDNFPSSAIIRDVYINNSGNDALLDGWTINDFEVVAESETPYFWSFQGQSTGARESWILPLDKTDFYQRNYMGMNDSDYGGGIPVVCLWRRDAGVAIGHLETSPQLVSLPVKMKGDKAEISIVKEYSQPEVWKSGESVATYNTFIQTYAGDCFMPLRKYSKMLASCGVVMPESEPAAFEPAWCAWGYERQFTIDEILSTLPKVKELGFKWATVDDGFQIAEGDWDLNRKRFPRGDKDMKDLVDKIHSFGLKAQLWWAPLAADPGTAFLRKYPESIIINKEGKPQDITWWDSWYLSPEDPDVKAETKRLVEKFIGEYGFDGLKLDGQHLNAVPEDYSLVHHPENPEQCVGNLPEFFKLIYDTARDIKPGAVIQNCPCGCCISVYNLPYANQTVSSDPLSSWQIRTKGYVLRAIAPSIAYYGDHVELSDGGNDFPTQLGIGSVIGTKFTWPKDNPYVETSYLLTPEKEDLVKKAIGIYKDKHLSTGEYVSGVYDIGYDFPETHLIRKDGKMYYAFYAKGQNVASVELRGLEKGRTYKVYDYWNDIDLGKVEVSEKTVLNAPFKDFLLLEVE